jgi:uncharacterized membrane protein YkoI
MKIECLPVGLLVGLLCVGCSDVGSRRANVGDGGTPSNTHVTADDDDDDDEQDIALSEVPAVVKHAAITAVPGLVLRSAEIEEENGASIYSLEGDANGKQWCVEVSPNGDVLDVEQEDDDDDDDGDDD